MRISYPSLTVGILMIAMWQAFIGLSVLPLETHEVYVIQTAQEMSTRNDWVVPFYNGKPRLNKPPLNYWCTAIAATLLGSKRFQPIHGRLPSAMSGVILVLLTMYIGAMLFGRSIGVIAGILLTSTMFFVNYTHNARPEMLYAMLCTAAFAFFLQAWRGTRYTKWASYGMWAAMGLATLTKGPHIPAILIVTFILIFMVRSTDRRRMFLILRPFTGALLFLLITVPWWLAVYYRVGPDIFKASQLAGSSYKFKLLNVLDPYYLYRPWSLLLPWVVLWPSMIVILFKRRMSGSGARFLAKMLFIPIIILSFADHKRWYYMLPFMAPACIWMALAARDLFLHNKFPQRVRQWIVPAHFIMVVVAIIILWVMNAQKLFSKTDHVIMITALFLISFLYGVLFYITRNRKVNQFLSGRLDILSMALLFVILNSAIIGTGIGHDFRFNQIKMADAIRSTIESDLPVVCYRINPDVLAYYTNRRIRVLHTLDQLKAHLKKTPDKELAIVIQDKLRSSLNEHMSVDNIATINNCTHKKNWSLIKVRYQP